jgi:cellulose synthase/poly-beta-1,6-N-acetylglucosamine synthase-like glycosyltransferase/peptidoglycan/xylan/chitin deacetylase (PgdA/CDA1 family)
VAIVILICLAWVSAFGLSLYYVARLPNDTVLAAQGGKLAGALRAVPPVTMAPVPGPAPLPGVIQPQTCGAPMASGPAGAATATAMGHDASRRLYTYLPYWSEWAYTSFGRNCGVGDVLLAERYSIDLPAGKLVQMDPNDGLHARVGQRLKTDLQGMVVLPVLTLNYTPPVATAAPTASALAARIAEAARADGYQGLCLAPDGFGDAGAAYLDDVVMNLSRDLHARGLSACLISAADDGLWQNAGLVGALDTMIVRAVRRPTAPEPLAPQDWFATRAEAIAHAVPKQKLVLMLGNFALDWRAGGAAPEEIPYAEAMRRAARHSAEVQFDPASRNATVDYIDADGAPHRIWMLDAATAFNQITVASRLGISQIGLWSLGTEDPNVWPLMHASLPLPTEVLTDVNLSGYVGYDGKGPFQIIASTMKPGRRSITLDPCTGLIARESYPEMPQPDTIGRFGKISPKKIVLTFDDGPDPIYSPQVLDVLKREKAPATFFVVGEAMLRAPGVVARMVREGHEVGSHTFLHDHFETVPGLQQRLELNAVQRLIVAQTGRGTVLFRFPYEDGDGPATSAEARPMSVLKDHGYVVVTGAIDTADWKRPPPQEIVDTVMQQLKENGGNVIVMHDGGGDRAATVAALAPLIEGLRHDGYQLVSLSDLLGVSRDAIMPPEGGAQTVFDQITFGAVTWFWSGLRWIFWVVIFLGLGRMAMLVSLALLRRRRPAYASYRPSVSVIIPAYNEEAVIVRTIEAVLANRYPNLDVVVVDDGSTDHTYERLAAVYRSGGPVTLVRQANQGKWKALRTGYGLVDSEIVVAIDSDTLLAPDAIEKLVQPFRDPKVGAVAGNVKVGNRDGLLTRLQALEYITAQAIDRRAAEVFGGIMVVPGAIGAWRTEAVREVRLYSNDTLAEDADLTIALHRAGYKIAYREDAFSYTEAPSRLRPFLGQRLRWTLGMMQAGWKHRRAIRELRAVGLISLLDLLFFGVLLGLLAPVADLVFLNIAIRSVVDLALGHSHPAPPDAALVLVSYLALPLADVATAALAFRLERGENARLLLLVPLQRFCYRQLLYFTVYRAVLRSISGQLASWGKLARLGTVRLPGRPVSAPVVSYEPDRTGRASRGQ